MSIFQYSATQIWDTSKFSPNYHFVLIHFSMDDWLYSWHNYFRNFRGLDIPLVYGHIELEEQHNERYTVKKKLLKIGIRWTDWDHNILPFIKIKSFLAMFLETDFICSLYIIYFIIQTFTFIVGAWSYLVYYRQSWRTIQ